MLPLHSTTGLLLLCKKNYLDFLLFQTSSLSAYSSIRILFTLLSSVLLLHRIALTFLLFSFNNLTFPLKHQPCSAIFHILVLTLLDSILFLLLSSISAIRQSVYFLLFFSVLSNTSFLLDCHAFFFFLKTLSLLYLVSFKHQRRRVKAKINTNKIGRKALFPRTRIEELQFAYQNRLERGLNNAFL